MAKKSTKKSANTKNTKNTKSQSSKGPKQFVYFFGNGKADGNRAMKDTLGGKGAGLAEMTNAGLPVPAGFTISTDACNLYYANKAKLPANIETEMVAQLRKLEKVAGAQLGSKQRPLLVSVRSGAKFSMPGMMDTILNLGLNDETVEGLKAWTGNGRFAFDSYRRFMQMFGSVVLEIPKARFEHEFESVKHAKNATLDTDLDELALREVVAAYKKVVKAESKKDFPQDPMEQLRGARNAVFRSWNNARAREYRRIYDIPDSIGTAVNVQMMVFGNTGDRSGTGVGFTRNPATGAKEFFGEFLINAQGEDVVAGIRTPQPIVELEKVMPKAYKQLREITSKLERNYKDIQDFEFTIQDEKLYMLQTRSGKRTGYAAVVIATDFVKEKLVTPKEAILLVDPEALSQLLAPGFDPKEWKAHDTVTKGLPASPGAACGKAVFSSETAVEWSNKGEPVILVRRETVPDDIHGMWVSQGILTATGAKEFFGEFLINAQGEDVVAGIRTPQPIVELEKVMPKAYKQLRDITSKLERNYKDIQDFEFTIQDEKLYMLQTRSGKRTGYAAVVIATDFVKEKLVTPKEAILLVDPEALSQLLAPGFDPKEWKSHETVTKGLPASPGAACGKAVFSSETAVEWSNKGEPVILVRRETVPDDIHGMWVSQGILTATGGMTSHAAVVGRQMGKPSIVGAGELRIDEHGKSFTVKGKTVKEGDYVAFDGLTGEVKLAKVASQPSEILQVVAGKMKPSDSPIYQRFNTLLEWTDRFRRLGVRANADQPDQAELAYAFGARGIGLCRTEHMFFGEGRIPIVQRMILADNEADRRAALNELLPMQREDFYGVFKGMKGTPVTIRTIDPPLHEFLPKREDLMVEIAVMTTKGQKGKELDDKKALLSRVEQLHEFNPMLGHRGVRLGITYPEITEMQTRAIMEAACKLNKEGLKVVPEIMIPLVGDVRELRDQKQIVDRVCAEVIKETGVKIKYLVGTMIEVPRGALTADEVATEAQFFSFGTNDLTQMTFGFSRDDVGKFLKVYQDKKLLERDPFATFDGPGTGQLVAMAVQKGRATRKDIKLGICGEHGGDPASIHFFHQVGLDYVSCSPYRVPVARLAAAQAALSVKVGD